MTTPTISDTILKDLSQQIHKHLNLKGNPAPLNTNNFYEWHQHTRLAQITDPSVAFILLLKECLRYRLHQIDHLKDALPHITEDDTLLQIKLKHEEACTRADNETRKKLLETLRLTKALCATSIDLSATHSNFQYFQDSILSIDKLWRQCTEHGATIKHPIAPIVEAWLFEQNALHITQEQDRRRPTGLLPKLTLGSVRDVVLEYDGPGQLPTDSSASRPQLAQLDMWEPEPDSVLGPVLVWHQPLVHPITLETPTTRRGAVSHAVRTIEEVFCALTPEEFKSGIATIKIDLGVLLYARHPDLTKRAVSRNRAKYLRPILLSLEEIDTLGWLLKDGRLYTPVKIGRFRPTLSSHDDTPVIFDVEIPSQKHGNMLVGKKVLRHTAKAGLPQHNAAKAAYWLVDEYGTRKNSNGKHYIIDPTKPVERRDKDGWLLHPETNIRLYDERGKPIKNLKSAAAAKRLPRERDLNAQKRYPLITPADRIMMAYPQGHTLQRADAKKRADNAIRKLHENGHFIVDTVPDDANNAEWRLMPTENHVRDYRTVRDAKLKAKKRK